MTTTSIRTMCAALASAGLLAAAYNPQLFEYDRKAPLDLREAGVEKRGEVEVHDVSYASPMGGRVTAYIVKPAGKGPFAGILFMHGGNGNRSSLLPGALTMARTGAVCLLIDSPLNGARAIPGERLADFTKPDRTRSAMIQTVVDLRRGVDVLTARSDVDRERLGYIGASFGGSVGGILAGVEKRIKAYCLLVGTGSIGDWARESRHPTAEAGRRALTPEQLDRAAATLADIEPVWYVARAAPSALFFQNGRKDPLMPIPGVERYHAAGSEPKLVRWYDAGHGLNAEAFRDRAEWLSKRIGIGPLPADVRDRIGSVDSK